MSLNNIFQMLPIPMQFMRKLTLSPIFKKNHHQQRTGPALSESFSGDVPHPIQGSPTDTFLASDEAVQVVAPDARQQTPLNEQSSF